MADAGVGSRRGSEDLIRAGRVTVDGRPAIIGEKVDPELQQVEVDGKPSIQSRARGPTGF